MGENSKIQWCDHTFNPWWLCTEVGPGCQNCYAESFAKRYGYGWGQGVLRRFFGDKHWNEPLKWNEKAKREGKKKKVFCASMADWADNEVGQEHRDRLFALIKKTDWLIWQLLTKRVGNAKKMLPKDWGDGYENVWFGITVINQGEANRDIPKMLQIPARLRWLSIEPQLGPIDFNRVDGIESGAALDWCVYGGESGPLDKVRPFDLRWARDGIRQCREAGVAVFYKQGGTSNRCPHSMSGAHFECFPTDLQVRELPDDDAHD